MPFESPVLGKVSQYLARQQRYAKEKPGAVAGLVLVEVGYCGG